MTRGGHGRGAAEKEGGALRDRSAALVRCGICGDYFLEPALFGHIWSQHLSERLEDSEHIRVVLERAFERLRKAGLAP